MGLPLPLTVHLSAILRSLCKGVDLQERADTAPKHIAIYIHIFHYCFNVRKLRLVQTIVAEKEPIPTSQTISMAHSLAALWPNLGSISDSRSSKPTQIILPTLITSIPLLKYTKVCNMPKSEARYFQSKLFLPHFQIAFPSQ